MLIICMGAQRLNLFQLKISSGNNNKLIKVKMEHDIVEIDLECLLDLRDSENDYH